MKLRATDPHQYDSPNLDWRTDGAVDSPTRRFVRNALDGLIDSGTLQGKRAIDIGCGVGHLFPWLKEKGASEIVGIDPSRRNIQAVKELYPQIESVQATLEEFAGMGKGPFDVAFAILVFEHIEDLSAAFQDVRKLLAGRGDFYLLSGNKDYHLWDNKKIRKSIYSIEILQELNDGAVETKVVRQGRENHTMYDIVRPVEHFLKAAKKNGFELVQQVPLRGPIGASKPEEFAPMPICYLYHFKVSEPQR